ncbi:hypothetical protein ACP70R_007686 [Stipagrostis hirtigluma subsp. patula]
MPFFPSRHSKIQFQRLYQDQGARDVHMGNTSSSSAAAATTTGGNSSTSSIVSETVTGSHVLRIFGYSGTKGLGVGKSINSGTFTVGGHGWYVAYFPDGERDEVADFISVYLYLDHPAAKDAAVQAQFEFNLLDRSGKPVPAYRKTSTVATFSHVDGAHRRWGFRNFILQRKDLEWSSHLRDDSFQIRCDVTLVTDVRVETAADQQSIVLPPPEMCTHLGDVLASGVGVDVTFMVGGEVFRAHKIVLAARSPVFMAELFGHMKENAMSCLQIDEMDARVFGAMLHFIYTESLPKIDESDEAAMAQHLLVAADRYSLGRLKLICEDTLRRYIDATTGATTLALAEQHGCHVRKEACFKFLKSPGNLMVVMASASFQHLKSSCPAILEELLAMLAKVAH